MGNYYTPKKPEPPTCPHNEGVECDNYKQQPCHRCGWNPEVARERLLKICFDMGIDIPESILEKYSENALQKSENRVIMPVE